MTTFVSNDKRHVKYSNIFLLKFIGTIEGSASFHITKKQDRKLNFSEASFRKK